MLPSAFLAGSSGSLSRHQTHGSGPGNVLEAGLCVACCPCQRTSRRASRRQGMLDSLPGTASSREASYARETEKEKSLNSSKMQRRKVHEETRITPGTGGVRTVLQSLLRLQRSSAHPGHAYKMQTHHGRADTALSGLRQTRGTGKCRKTFLIAKGISAWSCSSSDEHRASKAHGLHGT